jgi:hypothetical protein
MYERQNKIINCKKSVHLLVISKHRTKIHGMKIKIKKIILPANSCVQTVLTKPVANCVSPVGGSACCDGAT